MKKLLILFLFIPTIIFAQSKNKSFLVLSGGKNLRTSEILVNNTNNGFNFDISFERTAGYSLAWGFGLEFSSFPSNSSSTKGRFRSTLGAMLKVQNNSVAAEELQPFVKLGAGLSLMGGGSGGHPNFPGGGFTYTGAAGINYMTNKHIKLFLESGYKTSPLKEGSYSNVYLNLGISLDLR